MVSVVSATSVCQEDLPVGIFSGALGARQFFKVVLKKLKCSLFFAIVPLQVFHSIPWPYKPWRSGRLVWI